MRNRFDQLGKEIALRALELFGRADVQVALDAETLYADVRHEPVPEPTTDRERLGLLGLLTSRPCLLELYSETPSIDDLRTCIVKHLLFGQQRVRDARAGGDRTRVAKHRTWILSAGVPKRLLSNLLFQRAHGPPGVYVLGGDFGRVGISIGLVVASQLPTDRSTLLVRLMAGGAQLVPAVRELGTLPEDSIERIVVEPILLSFHHELLHTDRVRSVEEEEFIMAMSKSWAEVRQEGREEGREEVLRRLLELKFGAIPPELAQRISVASPAEIGLYLERVLFASTISDVFA